MMKLSSISRFAVVVMTICSMVFTSCGKRSLDSSLQVSLKDLTVGSAAGSQFVSVRCASDWTLWLVSDEGEEVGWARISANSGTGNKNNVILSYDENRSEGSRELMLILDDGRKMVKCAMVQQSAGQTQGAEKPSSGVDLTKTGWLELPAMDNSELSYFSHSFTMNGKKYRNYSFGWSQKDRVSLWVAYPLSQTYMSGYDGRANAWALDPYLGGLSAAPFSGYAGSYARGHLLASEDRQCCYEANAQTFYGTNIVPQIQDNFNGGVWSALEGKVRVFAQSADTLYVVTGVTVSASSRKEKDSNGNSVTVPDAFFKALLKYKRGSTLGDWNAAAFYYPHTTYSGGVQKSHSMSIDELEEITGIDFFANLPTKIGDVNAANVEQQVPANSSVWW